MLHYSVPSYVNTSLVSWCAGLRPLVARAYLRLHLFGTCARCPSSFGKLQTSPPRAGFVERVIQHVEYFVCATSRPAAAPQHGVCSATVYAMLAAAALPTRPVAACAAQI